ncbi:hypothetical protein T492DRAFT_888509 [Pavlovales sp. CCMP2436]|nr:hypothetical protein T492DRAFT_888509 [Pavlovales sp. CCMP2436]
MHLSLVARCLGRGPKAGKVGRIRLSALELGGGVGGGITLGLIAVEFGGGAGIYSRSINHKPAGVENAPRPSGAKRAKLGPAGNFFAAGELAPVENIVVAKAKKGNENCVQCFEFPVGDAAVARATLDTRALAAAVGKERSRPLVASVAVEISFEMTKEQEEDDEALFTISYWH